MAKQAPNPIDVQDFQFKLHCRLKIFANDDNNTFNKSYSLIASASRFGLIFVGTSTSTLQIIQVNGIEKYTLKDGEITNYKRRSLLLPSRPKHLTVNCDNTKLAVVVEKDNCPVAIVYDVLSFMKQYVGQPLEIRLSATPGVNVTEANWNPSLPAIFTACKDDKTLGLYEIKEAGIGVNELPADSQASCMCWSPKGKQIAVGSCNGTITQYKPDLKATKIINVPPLGEQQSVVAIQWISNYQFIAIYRSQSSADRTSLLVVDAPKIGESTFTNYEDICYSYGNVRPIQFYAMHQPIWNVLMVASSNSMEVGVLGNKKDSWTQWILADAARAELPLSATKQETLPIGIAFNTSATEPVVWGEASLPPAPFLLLLSHHGLLCCFRVINIKSGVASICQAPEPITDASGLNQFVAEDNKTTPASARAPPPQSFTPQAQAPLFTTPIKQPIIAVEKQEIFPSPILKTNVSQPIKPLAVQQEMPKKNVVIINQPVTTVKHDETITVQEETDVLISKLISEEYETLETELKVLLHKARSLKMELGSDTEDAELVRGTDALDSFLKEINDINVAQNAEVYLLKQGLIQTWAWYEDARSRISQTHDTGLEALLRLQQLDPVFQRYLADIQHMVYYMESQLMQASRTLDEQWENFQDSCRKVIRHQIPTMETIYQTMVKHGAIYQKQMYILKDISNRIRAHRSKINGPSLFASLNNIDQLFTQLKQIQLEPQHLIQVQYQRTLQNQKRLTKSKVKKLSKLLLERDVTRVTIDKPQLSNIPLRSLIQSVSKNKGVSESNTILGAAVSPIAGNKNLPPRVVEFVQSTPKPTSESGAPVTFVKVTATIPAEAPVKPTTTKTTTFKFTDAPNANFNPSIKPNIIFPSVPNSSPIVVTASSTLDVMSGPKINQVTNAKSPTSAVPFFATTKSATTFNFSPNLTTSAPIIFSQVPSKPLPSTSSSAFVPTTQLAFNFNSKNSSTTSSGEFSKPSTFVFGEKMSTFNFTAQTNSTANVTATTTSSTVPLFGQSKMTSTITPSEFSSSKLTITNTTSTAVVTFTTTTINSKQNHVKTESSSIAKTDTTNSSRLPATTATVFTPTFGLLTSIASQAPFGEISTATGSGSIFGNTATTVSTSAFANKTEPIATSSIFGTTSIFSSSPAASSNLIFGPAVATTTSSSSGPTTVTTSSIFSSTTTTTSPSVFDSPVTTTTSVFSSPITTTALIFGSPAATATSVFGSPAPVTTTVSIFGSPVTSATPIFVSTATTTTSVFGSIATTAAQSLFGAGTTTTTSIFGSNIPITTQSIFGLTVTTTASLFGSLAATTSASVFGASSTQPLQTSTATISSSVFDAKSVTATTTTTSNFVFAIPAASKPTAFGASTSTNSIFGGMATTNATFLQTTTVPSLFTTPTSSIFSTPSKTTSSLGPFAISPTTTTAANGFGVGTTVSGSLFAQPTTFGSQSIFGAPVSTSSNIFGGNTTSSAFGSGESVFGAPNTTSNVFGQSQASTFSFAAAAANISTTNSGFEFSKASAPFGFGTPTTTNSNSFNLGALNMGSATTTTANAGFGSLFGQPANNINPFAKANEGTNLFGMPATTTTASIFGGGSSPGFGGSSTSSFGSNSAFGSPSGFGSQSSFGQTSFGGGIFSNAAQPGPFSGGNQSVAQSGFGAFGQAQKPSGFGAAPVFGGSPGGFGTPPAFGSGNASFGGASTFGSPPKMFGSPNDDSGSFGAAPQQQNSTFANLATQNTLGFGSLAQQSPTTPPSQPFSSGSSFSTWR